MKSISIFLVFMLTVAYANSQGRCGTIQTEEMTQSFLDNKKHWNQTLAKGSMPNFIPVTFHLVANNDGSSQPTEELALEGLCILNESFELSGSNMFFYVKEFNVINNTAINTNPSGSGFLMRNQTDGASINVFIVDEIASGGLGRILGFYSPNGDYLVMRKDQMTARAYTLEHEIGHFFTLRHTHYGWDGQYYDPSNNGDTIFQTSITITEQGPIGDIVSIELQDGSNCDTAGDLICDTPPDYGFGFSCNCCILPWEVFDRNGDAIEPLMENIMSYSQGCDIQTFSPDQLVAIQASLDANNRDYLRTNVTETQYRPVRGEVALTSPAAGETVEIFDEVTFEWEPVENAEYYIVTIIGSQTFRERTTEPRLTFTELQPNEFFASWSVRAYNVFGGGCNGSVTRNFNTGTSSSAVNELDFVSELNIYPNPITSNSDITVQFTSTQTELAQVKLHTITGALVHSSQVQIQSGENRVLIDESNVTSGILILEIKTKSGSILEKIIVE